MPAKLIIESDADKSRTEVVFDKPRITLGRRAGNDLHFNRPEISGNHAAFLLEAGLCYLQDLGSTNGTLLNGAPVVANEKYPLQDQDLITIAPYRITFVASRDMSSTMLESNALKELRQAGSGTIYEPLDRIATGTAEHAIPGATKPPSKGTGTEPDMQPTFAAPPAPAPPPEPAPAAPPPAPAAPAAAPAPKPAAAKPAAPRPAPAAPPAELPPLDEEDLKAPSALSEYIWLAVGGIILIVAIALVALIFLF